MYIDNRLFGMGEGVVIQHNCGFQAPDTSNCLAVVPGFSLLHFFLCYI